MLGIHHNNEPDEEADGYFDLEDESVAQVVESVGSLYGIHVEEVLPHARSEEPMGALEMLAQLCNARGWDTYYSPTRFEIWKRRVPCDCGHKKAAGK